MVRERVGRERSPNYPGVGLQAAVDLLNRLFERERRSTVPVEEAVKAWGHEKVSGPARVRLAALRQYDLVDVLQGGKVKVSDLGLTLCIMPPGSPEHGDALKEAALAPPLFRLLWDTKRDASDGNLRHHLMRERGFSLDGADRLIKSYRSTVTFGKLVDESYNGEAEQNNGEDVDVQLLERQPDTGGATIVRAAANSPHFRYGLSENVTAEVTFSGPFTTDDLQMLREFLELQERGLKRRSPELSGATDVPSLGATDPLALPEPEPER